MTVLETTPMVPLSDSFVAAVLEMAPDGIAVTDEMGRIVLANGFFEDLFGYGRDELLGSTVEMLLPEAMRATHRGHRDEFEQYPTARPMGPDLDLWGLHADGTTFAIEVGLSPLSTARGVNTIIGVRPRPVRRHSGEPTGSEGELLADRERVAVALNDRVIKRIFSASLRLQGLIEGATVRQVAALLPSFTELDDAIREVRLVVFESLRHSSSLATPPNDEAS